MKTTGDSVEAGVGPALVILIVDMFIRYQPDMTIRSGLPINTSAMIILVNLILAAAFIFIKYRFGNGASLLGTTMIGLGAVGVYAIFPVFHLAEALRSTDPCERVNIVHLAGALILSASCWMIGEGLDL